MQKSRNYNILKLTHTHTHVTLHINITFLFVIESIESIENEITDCEDEPTKKKRKIQHIYSLKEKNTDKNVEAENRLKSMLPETPAKNVESNVTSIFSSTHETSSNAMKYLKCILSDIQGIKHDQQIIKNHLWNIKDTFEQYLIQQNHESENVLVHWTKTNNIQWPLKTKEDYDTLNNPLQNEEIRNDFGKVNICLD
ncbi:uncharacterized protein LOC116852214 [Odontomachus brunneus]|uniref:uncharacterized protein LOC116852214 n=1 Tax=Odontomachus brunneus TaxID=486640 RepID=UPI0013F224D5|nr:uncharacterized protein LOC116852214 [Odontomachus brunneus]